MKPSFISIEQAAKHTGVSAKTIRRRIADGSLSARRMGPRLIRIEVDELEQLMRPIPTAGRGAA